MENSNDTGKITHLVSELLTSLKQFMANCTCNGEMEPCKLWHVLTEAFAQWKCGENTTRNITQKNGLGNCRLKTCFPPLGGVCTCANSRATRAAREGLPKKRRRLIPLTTLKTVFSDHTNQNIKSNNENKHLTVSDHLVHLSHENGKTAILSDNKNKHLTTSDHLECEKPLSLEEEIPVSKGRRLVSTASISKSRRIVKPKIRKQKPDPMKYDVPTSVKPIWEYWVTLGLHTTGPDTKAFKRDVRAVQTVLRGSFFKDYFPEKNRSYTQNEIKQAIARFALAATNPDYEPARKGHLLGLTLHNFFWNAYGRLVHSYFLKFTEEKPKLLRGQAKPLEDANPAITNALLRKHYRTVPEDLTQHTKNQFITGAAKLRTFYDTVYLRNISISPEPIGQIADYLCECLAKTFGHANVKPANYASNWTFNQCLPEYLSEIAAWDIDLEGD